MKPEELADLIERLRQAGKNFPTLRMLTDDAEEALRRVEKLEAALGPLYEACMTADERGELVDEVNGEILDLARQALTGEA